MTRNKSSPIDINDAADRPSTSPAVPPTSDKNSKLVYSGFQGFVFTPFSSETGYVQKVKGDQTRQIGMLSLETICMLSLGRNLKNMAELLKKLFCIKQTIMIVIMLDMFFYSHHFPKNQQKYI